MKNILFVDDEMNILQGLRRMLRPMRKEWNMSFANGGKEAIELISNEKFDVVVTDMRMPVVDGVKVLEYVRDHDAGIARIVLSGQTDKEAILKSTGTAHQFIAKPCDTEQLKRAILRSCQLRELLRNKEIADVVSSIDALPSLPNIYIELTNAINTEADEITMKALQEIICKDISMSAKVLQLANSAFFGLSRVVETAEQAVSILGVEAIRTLALTDAVFKTFDAGNEFLNLDTIWEQSISVSLVAQAIAKFENAEQHLIDQTFQAGVLHDIGKLILATALKDEYKEVCKRVEEQGTPFYQREYELFGCDHGQIGAYLLGLWGLPDGIVEAVAYHHHPEKCPQINLEFSPLTAVYIANMCVDCLESEEPTEVNFNHSWLELVGCENKADSWMTVAREVLEKQGRTHE